MILAQAPGSASGMLPTPDVAWSSFAPELVLVVAALLLLMFAITEGRQLLVAIPTGLLAGAAGVWLVTQGRVAPGAVAIALGAATVAIVVGVGERPPLVQAFTAGAAALGALVLSFWQYVAVMAPDGGTATASTLLGGSVAMDGISLFTRITVYLTTLLVIPIGYGYLQDRGVDRPEFEPLLLLSATGMALLGAAADLITLFIALEILSIALYILCGFARRDRRSQESGLKYFLTGSVASAILLYGMALLYVSTGTLDLGAIGTALGLVTTSERVAVLGLALVTAGIGFKIALVPFHLWTPDVYQGAPTNVTAFMAAATKAAGFAAVLRLYLLAFGRLEDLWVPIVAGLAAVTMIYGAVVALVQRDVKRILAFSSIAHAGYATIGVVANSDAGLSGTLWYLLTYAVTTLAAFGCVVAIERRRRGEVALVDLRGLGRTSPALAGILTLALLSLAGIPPTAGFAGKLVVFQAGIAAGFEWLVVIGVVSSVIAAFFYLRLMGMMFLEDPVEGTEVPVVSTGVSFGVAIAAALVIYLGVQPGVLLTLADNAAVLAR
ncbi:MAG: NADH-quinone oxidoreductase subunit N [Actinobacteria bacterium]|nr:NADH-quinone oxidoreductase subunit N [Actinomycetota bacterium]